MPHLAWFLLRHAVVGFGAAIATVAAMMLLDVGGLRTLLFQSDAAWLALFLLTFFMGLTFGSAQMGFAIMSENGPGGGKSPDRPPRRGTRFRGLDAPAG